MKYVTVDVQIFVLYPKRRQIDIGMQVHITNAYFISQLNFALNYINFDVIYAKQVW